MHNTGIIISSRCDADDSYRNRLLDSHMLIRVIPLQSSIAHADDTEFWTDRFSQLDGISYSRSTLYRASGYPGFTSLKDVYRNDLGIIGYSGNAYTIACFCRYYASSKGAVAIYRRAQREFFAA